MKVPLAFIALATLTCAFQVSILPRHKPETHIGNKAIACTPGTPGNTSGFGTYYSDVSYACANWNGKTKGRTDCFVALNGICGTDPSKFCDKCVNVVNADGYTEKCRIIDFCDPNNCEYYDAGHLDFLTNNGNANFKFIDNGVYVYPYSKLEGEPKILWSWTTCT